MINRDQKKEFDGQSIRLFRKKILTNSLFQNPEMPKILNTNGFPSFHLNSNDFTRLMFKNNIYFWMGFCVEFHKN